SQRGPDGGLARSHEAGQVHVLHGLHAFRRGRISPSESPPNFSRSAFARTRQTRDSPITAAAGTAQASERSTCAFAGFIVRRSTESSGFIKVAIGFIAARATNICPVVIPPSMPP